ncbi:hypothetical protein MBLNU230_g1298t1 [Neophaeotheca triangularis]
MHPFSILTAGIFVAGYITARWDLVTRLYELAIFAWDHGVVTRAAKGFAILSLFFFLLAIPIDRIAAYEAELVSISPFNPTLTTPQPDHGQHPRTSEAGISAREQLRRRGSF